MHVRTHQGTGRVIVGKERNTSSRDGDDLFRRNVDVRNEVRFHFEVVVIVTDNDVGALDHLDGFVFVGGIGIHIAKFHRSREVDVGFSDIETAFVVRGQIFRFRVRNIGFSTDVVDLTIRSHDETVLVDLGIGAKVINKTDVLSFRGFNRADTSIVSVMDVADFHGGAISGQTARA